MKKLRLFRLVIALFLSKSITLAQTPNINQQAVDTLTKEVAKAVFEKISQDPRQTKAQEIYAQLVNCGSSCDPQLIIHKAGQGSWDAVGVKLNELTKLKNSEGFQSMSSNEANNAIRKQLTDFYNNYKNDNNYSKSLNSTVQAQILTKISELLPLDQPESAEFVNPSAADTLIEDDTIADSVVSPQSQLSSQEKEVDITMIIIGVVAGLVLGGGAVYLLLYRSAQAEINALQDENNRLRNSLETAQRTKPGPDGNSIRSADRQKLAMYDAIVAELGGENPLTAIRQLKQQTGSKKPENRPATRLSDPVIEPTTSMPAEQEPIQAQQPLPPLPPLEPLPPLNRFEVFYFPPPDPSGQFDLAQKSPILSPESAYRFSVNADNPTLATFRFEADPGRVARFLTYRNYMIEPACDSENSYTTVHTRITMRRDGEAALENGVWRVKTKALIRYE